MRSVLALVALAACTVETPSSEPSDADPPTSMGGQFGEEDEGCVEVSSVPLAVDDVGTLGFAPQDVLDLAVGDHALTMTWVGGESTGLAVEVVDLGEAWEVVYDDLESDEAGGCPTTVAVSVNVGFVTDDGSFDEHWDLRLEGVQAGEVTHVRRLESLDGTFELSDHTDTSVFDDTWSELELRFDAAGVSGEVWGIGESSSTSSGGDPTDTATILLIGTFE